MESGTECVDSAALDQQRKNYYTFIVCADTMAKGHSLREEKQVIMDYEARNERNREEEKDREMEWIEKRESEKEVPVGERKGNWKEKTHYEREFEWKRRKVKKLIAKVWKKDLYKVVKKCV